MRELVEGYQRFMQTRWPAERAMYEQLVEGQRPGYLVIACSDSRVNATKIFQVKPGEAFIVRNVANLVPPFEQGEGLHGTSAAIEFAVEVLGVHTILVLGHESCGGVRATLAGEAARPGHFLRSWISLLEPARAAAAGTENPQLALEQASIKLSLERLMGFPFVASRVAEGKLSLEGGHFRISDGGFSLLDRATGEFLPVR